MTADQGGATIPVTLAVWNVELPVQPAELSLWSLVPPASGRADADLSALGRALTRNKVMSWVDLAGNAASDIPNFGLSRSGLEYYYYVGIECSGAMNYIPSTSEINGAAANFPAGLSLDLLVGDALNNCPAADADPMGMSRTPPHPDHR